MLTEMLTGWSLQEVVVFIGTTAIVLGLCITSFGDKGESEHLKRSGPDEAGP